MLRVTAMVATLALAISGCAGKSLDCPDEYGQLFEDIYLDTIKRLEENGVEPPADADRDCIPDITEKQFGSDPEDPKSYPTLADLANATPDGTPAPPPLPPPTYQWVETTFERSFQSIPQFALGATGAIFTFDMPMGAQQAYLNVTVTSTAPDEYNLHFRDEETSNLDAPTATLTTDNGEGSAHLSEAPKGGEWTTSVFSQVSPNVGHVVLKVNAYLPVVAETPET